MTDQEVKTQIKDPVGDALNEIAITASGQLFLRWLKDRCFFDRSTISGNPETYEVNPLGTIAQEFQRRLYLDIRRKLKPAIRRQIEQ